jgi:hypothetical protein
MGNFLYDTFDLLAIENGELRLKLLAANDEIGNLKLEVKRLEDGSLELSIKLEDIAIEKARMVMVTKHRVEAIEHVKRNIVKKY